MATTERKKSAVDSVVDRITGEIISGELSPGDRLLTEPELSAKYGVGRNSVREAIKQLQAFGVLYIKRADGTYVTESFSQPMLDPLLYGLILKKSDWNDFVQLRAVIDIGTLEVALSNPDVTSIVPHLYSLIDELEAEMKKDAPDEDKILEKDLEFHRAIANTINNDQINTMTDYIVRMTVPSRRETVKKWLEKDEVDRFLNLHRQLADVIEHRDTERITQAVMEHYVLWK
jgi:DNA-binding FadR family transcriptional regulator